MMKSKTLLILSPVLGALLWFQACGVKGPPLPPLVVTPQSPDQPRPSPTPEAEPRPGSFRPGE